MADHLATLLEELRSVRPNWGANAATENMRTAVVTGAPSHSIREFLASASTISLGHARDAGVSPVTFYAWCDEQAGQLRFSIAPCNSDKLPFGARVRLMRDPGPIAKLAVAASDLIPWEDFDDVSCNDVPEEADLPHIMVWARSEGAG